MISLILIGAILFGMVAFVVIRSTRTVNAVVPNQEIKSGERIEASMLSIAQVPVGTPEGYITDKSSLVGQKLKISAQSGQLMYMSDVMVSWDDVVYGVSVPDDYVVTAINIPNDRAVGGLITAGDTVDVLGVAPDSKGSGNDDAAMKNALGAMLEHSYGANGIHVYWILANVKILETNSTLSNKDNSMLSTITDGTESEDSAYYIVALSYADYQKITLVQQYLKLYMNMSPVWNNENPPLLDQMQYAEVQGLMDAQAQSIIEEIKGENGEVTRKIDSDALKDTEEAKKKWAEENGYRYVAPSSSSQSDASKSGESNGDGGSSSSGDGGAESGQSTDPSSQPSN